MTVELSPTDITELIEHSVRLVEADALSRDVNIRMKISDLTKLPMDPNQITQALLNLLLNALQALPQKGNIEIGADLDASDSRLNLWVKDDGPGLRNNLIEKIFEPFYTTHEKGTGLGLAIVHKIAENHNGEIRVNSPPKGMTRGCCFSIVIPIIVNRKTRDKFKRTEN
jgi:two-component system sensor histidine kinase HydH